MVDETAHGAQVAESHTTITPKILYFGTPVVLLSTENADGTANLAPMSSAWALGDVVVLGMGAASQTAANLAERPDVVINLPGPGQWDAVERLAPTTGRHPVPAHKQGVFRHESDKFGIAGLTASPSETVRPPRVRECPLQLEAAVTRLRPDAGGSFLIAEAAVSRVHAATDIVVPGTSYVDPARWSPLIYNFRHYFGLGSRLGRSFRAEH
ncbi:flavin reductase family protein [Actinoallomurus acanthiterrae]